MRVLGLQLVFPAVHILRMIAGNKGVVQVWQSSVEWIVASMIAAELATSIISMVLRRVQRAGVA